MARTGLVVEGFDIWGNKIRRRVYNDGNGNLMVAVRQRGSLRRTMVPYRQFMAEAMGFGYIIERAS